MAWIIEQNYKVIINLDVMLYKSKEFNHFFSQPSIFVIVIGARFHYSVCVKQSTALSTSQVLSHTIQIIAV